MSAVLAFLWWWPSHRAAGLNVSPEREAELEDKLRGTWAQVFGGLAVIATGCLSYTNIRKSLELTREGQVTDRFNKAIDHLGAEESLAKRLGGIYALERIARDSNRDAAAVIDVLAAYVREHARREDAPPGQDIPGPAQLESVSVNAMWEEPKMPDLPPADIQAVLTVLGRNYPPPDAGTRLDLNGTDLRRIDLVGADLRGIDLVGANLYYAWLREANLSGANLSWADLRGSDLTHANLTGCSLRSADLRGATLHWTVLYTASLQNANVTDADLAGADLRFAKLGHARGLTQEQLDDADTDGTTSVRPPLTVQKTEPPKPSQWRH